MTRRSGRPFAAPAALAAAFALGAGACAVPMPDVPLHRFVEGDIAAVHGFAQQDLVDGYEENRALVYAVLAQCDLLMGRIDDARRNFEIAARLMGSWQVGGGEEFAAIVGSESSKTWRGDPYEKAMAAFYLGLCFLWNGEPDNARAAWKRGILADGEVGDEKYQADFALLFWLAGRASTLMGMPADADDFHREAKQANEFMLQHGSRGDP